MVIDDIKINGVEITLMDLDYIMNKLGFDRNAWDYKRTTYDYKYEDQKSGKTFYLRIPAFAVKGEIEEEPNESVLVLDQPYIGRHIYPHGFDYNYDFPSHIMANVKRKLEMLNKELSQVQE
jgi:hypothetical protein